MGGTEFGGTWRLWWLALAVVAIVGCNGVSAIDTSVLIDNLPAGTYYFAVTALSISGAESALSNIESKTVS